VFPSRDCRKFRERREGDVRNDMAEGGTNTLFLTAGFLRWKVKPDDPRTLRAPLLLIPVKLMRTSAISPFRLAHHEDDVRFNATLIQLLKKDFNQDLTEFETDSDAPLTFKANLLPSAAMEFLDRATQAGVAAQAHAGNGIVISPDGAHVYAAA
jgi:hypothetical protein